MITNAPKVSIILPVYNAETTLSNALKSIFNQTYIEWELFIIDDGSTDKSIEIANKFKDHRLYIYSDGKHFNLPYRLNQGIGLSRGKYIARMDADDISFPKRIEKQFQFLENHPEVDLVGCRVIIFENSGNIIGTYPFQNKHSDICKKPWKGFYLPHPTWMGRKKWFEHNEYCIDAIRMEDQELLFRTYKKSCFECLPNYLVGYRQSELKLNNILTGRYHLTKLFLTSSSDLSLFNKFRAFLGQLFKSIIDTIAIKSNLTYRLLKHRALPVDNNAIDDWNKLWNEFNT